MFERPFLSPFILMRYALYLKVMSKSIIKGYYIRSREISHRHARNGFKSSVLPIRLLGVKNRFIRFFNDQLELCRGIPMDLLFHMLIPTMLALIAG